MLPPCTSLLSLSFRFFFFIWDSTVFYNETSVDTYIITGGKKFFRPKDKSFFFPTLLFRLGSKNKFRMQMEGEEKIWPVVKHSVERLIFKHQNPSKGHVGFSWKIVGIPFPVTSFFFCGKNFFSNFPKKCRIFTMKLTVKNFRNFFQWIQQYKNFEFFFNEIDCKKFSKLFSINSAVIPMNSVKNFEFFLIA